MARENVDISERDKLVRQLQLSLAVEFIPYVVSL